MASAACDTPACLPATIAADNLRARSLICREGFAVLLEWFHRKDDAMDQKDETGDSGEQTVKPDAFSADPRIKALVRFLARRAAERNYEEALAEKRRD
jgi:hypothetical protein